MSPTLGPWLDTLDDELAALGAETAVVCHSLACVLWFHHAARPAGPDRVARVLLVAPPSAGANVAEIEPFFPVPVSPAPVRAAAGSTVLVCSDDDPYCPEGAASLYGAPLGVETHVISGGGHLNPDAGLGPWPAAEAWCREGVWPSAAGPGGPERATP